MAHCTITLTFAHVTMFSHFDGDCCPHEGEGIMGFGVLTAIKTDRTVGSGCGERAEVTIGTV